MFILGLQGSPRLTGNTAYLLDEFLKAAELKGACVKKINIAQLSIKPCSGCGACEKTGECVIHDDDMEVGIYPLLRRADVVVAASPVYFYNMPSMLKALVDRSQAMWAKKHKLKLNDPLSGNRKGFLLSPGATRGENLFDGISLTAKYFFDAIGAEYTGMLGYNSIEREGDIAKNIALKDDIAGLLKKTDTMFARKKIMFACRENACRSQMASAFASIIAGDKVEALNAGSAPANEMNPRMKSVMAEIGIDMSYRTPRSIDSVITEVGSPDMIITMGCGEKCPFIPGTAYEDWQLPDPGGKDIEFMRKVRDEIRAKVATLTSPA